MLLRKQQVESGSNRTGRALWFLCLFVFLYPAMPATAQGPKARRQTSTQASAQTDASGLSAVAKTSLDAAVAALQANALDKAERNARAAVNASPRSAITPKRLRVVVHRFGKRNQAPPELNTPPHIDPTLVNPPNHLTP